MSYDPTAEGGDGGDFRDDQESEGEAVEEVERDRPLSGSLVRDLTTLRTAALRLCLGEQPELAARALAYTLALDVFYSERSVSCLEIRPISMGLAGWADAYDQSPAVEALQVRHDAWAAKLPNVPDLWAHILEMEAEDLGLLIAHCVALTINAVRQPHEHRPGLAFADTLATALSLDMTAFWRPTVQSYFGRVTKKHIADAVREAVSGEAADRMSGLKKPDMAATAQEQVAITKWLPGLLRTKPVAEPVAGGDAPDEPEQEPDDLPQAAE